MSTPGRAHALVVGFLAVAISACGPESPPPTPGEPLSISRVGSGRVFAREAGLTLTVEGSGFVPGAKLLLAGSVLDTEFLSSQSLWARIPDGATAVAAAGSVAVEVRNPDGETASPKSLVVDPAPPPELYQMTCDCSVPLAGRLQLTGSHFTSDILVTINAQPMQIAGRNGHLLSGTIPGLACTAAVVTVLVPPPGGGLVALDAPDPCGWDY
jgi:hypothetical protein